MPVLLFAILVKPCMKEFVYVDLSQETRRAVGARVYIDSSV